MVNEYDLTKAIVADGARASDGYFDYAAVVARRLPKRLHEQLKQLVDGPVWDGDVISKVDRDDLFRLGLAVSVCMRGQQGYTGATYFAYSVAKIAAEIKAGMRP